VDGLSNDDEVDVDDFVVSRSFAFGVGGVVNGFVVTDCSLVVTFVDVNDLIFSVDTGVGAVTVGTDAVTVEIGGVNTGVVADTEASALTVVVSGDVVFF